MAIHDPISATSFFLVADMPCSLKYPPLPSGHGIRTPADLPQVETVDSKSIWSTPVGLENLPKQESFSCRNFTLKL